MVKISIISGFLGSGKTTFIRKLLLEGRFGKHPILIENDYGALGIDSRILEKTGVEIREMNSGCICCSLVGNFILALEELIRKNNPEHIIIEPSGVGKLSEILDGLEELSVPYEKYLIFTIVDANRFHYNNLYVADYFWDQISHADVVVLSKTKHLSEQKLSGLYAEIRQKFADRDVVCFSWDEELLLLHDDKSPKSAENQALLSENTGFRTMMPKKAVFGKPRSSGEFESWSVETSLMYSEKRLYEIMDAFEHKNDYGMIVRAKGILNYPDGAVLLNYVPGEGKLSPIDEEATGEIVVIGTNLNDRALEKLFLTYS